MHILILPSSYPSPANQYQGCFVREQALALSKSGLQVGVLAPELHRLRGLSLRTVFQANRGWSKDGTIHCLRASQVGLPGSWERLRSGQFTVLANRLAIRYQERFGIPDIIHAHDVHHAGFFASKLKQRWEIPSVLTLHNSRWLRESKSQSINLLKVAIASADRVLAVSDFLADAVSRLGNVGQDKIGVLGNLVGPDHPGFQDPSGPIKRWVSIGALKPGKGHELLIRAFAQAFSSNPDCTLRIVGEGPERPRLEKLIENLQLTKRITLTGQLGRSEVFEELANAHAFALATQFETFGVAVLEALATGLPVVTTLSGGPESIVTEDDGLLVPLNKVSAFSDALVRCASPNVHWDRAAISKRAFSRFGPAAIAERLSTIYREVII